MTNLQKKVLPSHSLELLRRINSNNEFKDFYLVGGTALALLLGHRESVDLDFFTNQEFKANLIEILDEEYKVLALSNNSIEVVASNTKVMFLYFAFERVRDLLIIEGIRIADPIDIGLMKLLALQGRSTKKDIIDLFFIDKEIIKLEELLNLFEEAYPKESFNSYKSLKSLFAFDEIEKDPMPKLLIDIEWQEIFDLVIGKITKHLRSYTS